MKLLILILTLFMLSTATRKRRLNPRLLKEELRNSKNDKMSCFACTMIVDGIQTLDQNNATVTEIGNWVVDACIFLNLQEPTVCRDMINMYEDEITFVLARTLFTPDEICGAFIPDCGHSENPLNDLWNMTIPGNKPPVKPWPTISEGNPTYKFLHLSDIHFDRSYQVGSEAYCEMDNLWGTYNLCCRNFTDPMKHQKPIYVPAGKYGMPMNCDIPYLTFDLMMQHISSAHKDIDYIILTGDFESHDQWNYNQGNTEDTIKNVTDTFLKYFPNTPVYVSIGNHEGVPEDQMAPHTMEQYDTRGPQWLYSSFKDMTAHWIPSSALPDVQYRASYAVYPKPGLKLISINTIYCDMYNYYLYIQQRDPDSTLEWLIEQLSDSESKNEKVHIISHIPPGDNWCLKGWSWNFHKIIERYESTVTGLFFGHTHWDQFQVYYESSNPNTRPFHVNWISPSITTQVFSNPAYRIFTVDGGYPGASWTIKDADTYATDLVKANQANKDPVWTLEYNTRQFYGMKDLSPQSFSDLTDRLWTDHNLFKSFVKFYWRNDYDNECYSDDKCRRSYVCYLKTARSYDKSFCAGME